jgi:nitrogen regulatory protein PII
MYHMIMLILDDVDHCPDIFTAWENEGVSGITIIESTGLGRVRKFAGMRDDLPLMPNLLSLLQSREERHRTLIAVVKDEKTVDSIIDATQRVVGSLDEPNKGVIFVLPVARAVGLQKKSSDSGGETAR